MDQLLTPVVVDEETVQPPEVQPQEDPGITLGSPAGMGDGKPLVTLPPKLPPPVQPSGDLINKKTFKTTYSGIAELIGQSEESVRSSIASGQEDWIRREAASKIDVKNAQLRNDKIKQMAAQAGRPLDPLEVKRVLDPFNPEFGNANPEEVIERAYATAYVSSMNTAAGFMQDNYLDQSKSEIPDQTEETIAKTSTLAARRNFIQTKAQDIEETIKQQGYIGWGADQLKLLAQPYSEIKLRGLIKEVGALDGGLLLGNNVESTVDAIMDMPGPQFQKTVTNLLSKMKDDNPTLAALFAQTLLGASTSERRLNNVFTVLAPLDISGAVGTSLKVAKKVNLFNKLQNGYRDLAKGLEIENPTRATIAETAGNVEHASIIKAADNIIKGNDATLDLTKVAQESLMTGFVQDAEKLGHNVGSFTREAVTRIQDGVIKGGERLLLEAQEKMKVNRIPQVLAVEENVAALKQAERANYRGPKNTLLDVGDPVKNELTNTWHWPVRVGDHGNTLFKSEEAAQNFARTELKITDAVVKPAQGDVRVSEAGVTGSKTDLATKTRLERSIPATEDAIKKARITSEDPRNYMWVRKRAADSLRGVDGMRAILKRYKTELADANSRLKPTDDVVQKGLGFYIERHVPLNEGQDVVKDLMVKDAAGNLVPDAIGTNSATGFANLRNGVFGWFRGANQTLSKNEMKQRNVVSFSTTGVRKWLNEESQALIDVAKGNIRFDEVTGEPIPWYRSAPRPITGELAPGEAQEQFTRTLKFAQDDYDPVTKEPGYFKKTLGELETHYLTHFQRPPSFNEANAYFTFVKMVEAERVLMEISEYKYRSRLGVEQHQFWFNEGGGERILSGYVDGVDKKHLPGGNENILVLGNSKGEERLYKTNALPKKDRERWEQQIRDGQKKVIQLYSSGQRPLQEFSDIAGGERIVYVLADNVETKALDYNHVSRRGGGHFDLDYDNFVKQPIMTHSRSGDVETDKRGGAAESLYEGDRTLMPVDNRAMGKDIAKKMNEVIALMDKGNMDAAKAKYAEHKLPQDWEKFKGLFLPTKLGDKVVLPRYSTSERFEVVQKGQQIADMNKDLQKKYPDTFRDGTRSGDLSKQFQVEYNKERDSDRVYTINDRGSPGRPDYEYQPASLIDPMASFDRSMNRMINSTFMDDYKIYTVEHWLREASDYLKPSESELRSAPFAHFVTPEWKSGLASTDLAKISNLMSNRYKARAFIGLPSKFDTLLFQLQQTVADSLWEERNPAKRGALLIPHWLLPYNKEPVAATRSLAYNFKLGLYSPAQIFTQVNSWSTTIALEPRHGASGTYAALLHSWGSVASDPAVIAHLDRMATKVDMAKIMLGSSRWKLGEFSEARSELLKSGFLNVGGEMADLDRVFNNSPLAKGSIEKSTFVTAGQKPFQWGEKAARVPAWYTAYRKFRDENPLGALTDANRQEILYRANVLTNNMTRASNSIMNEGILSLPMQFLSYTYRLGETFFGKEIGNTVGERSLARLRLMATYGALYGLPSAVGVTGLPGGDKVRKYAVDNFGYVPGQNWYSTALMEGWPSLFIQKVTGNTYDVGGKWGTKGMTTISDLLKGDATWMKIVGGAGFDNIYKFVSGFDGWYKAMVSFARQDPEETRYKLTIDDMIKPALEISSVNALRQTLVAINTGKLIAKNGSNAMDVSKASAIFMGVTGLKPAAQAYAWDKASIRKEEIAMQKDALKAFLEHYSRSEMAAKNKDPDMAKTELKNGFAYLHASGMTADKILAAVAIAKKNTGNSIDRSDWDFAFGDTVPLDKRDQRKEQFIQTKKVQGQ